MRGLVLLVLMSGAPGFTLAAASSFAGTPAEVSAFAGSARSSALVPVAAAEASARALPYRDRSDEELTALAADWDSLDRHQRRALLTEMKLRMARSGEREGVLHIRTERRYGRIIRQSDGRVIRIETQVVHVRPVDAEDLEGRQSFGVGFEHRVGRRDDTAAAPQPSGEPLMVPSAEGDDAKAASQPSLESVLEGLAPSTQAPRSKRLPIYQVSDPES